MTTQSDDEIKKFLNRAAKHDDIAWTEFAHLVATNLREQPSMFVIGLAATAFELMSLGIDVRYGLSGTRKPVGRPSTQTRDEYIAKSVANRLQAATLLGMPLSEQEAFRAVAESAGLAKKTIADIYKRWMARTHDISSEN